MYQKLLFLITFVLTVNFAHSMFIRLMPGQPMASIAMFFLGENNELCKLIHGPNAMDRCRWPFAS